MDRDDTKAPPSPNRSIIKRWLAGGGLKARVAALAPVPNPHFDPFSTAQMRGPAVRELLVHTGPSPGSLYRHGGEGRTLAWG